MESRRMSNDASAAAQTAESAPRVHGLDAVLNPRSVAVIGASATQTKIGGRPLHHLRSLGFTGEVFPVNPNYDEVQGYPAYPSIRDTPSVPDLAIVAVPGPAVMDAVRDCAERGVRAVVLFSAGFAESGEEGVRLQQELTRIADDSGMRIVGPNCMGAANMLAGAPATFAAAVMLPGAQPTEGVGRIALVSQSGALGGHCVALAGPRGFAFDPWITTGNEADVDTADAIAHLVEQEDVSAVAVYLEGSKDGRRLRAALARAHELKKPVIMLKSGTSDIGAAAAASHTASLVGQDQAYDALFREHGVCRVGSVQELVDISFALAVGRLPEGPNVALFTGSGGAGILMADAAADTALVVPPLASEVQDRLKEVWPAAGVANPIDTTAQVTNDPALLPAFLNTVIEGGGFDTYLVFLTYLGLTEPWASNVVSALRDVREKHPEANIMTSCLASPEVSQQLVSLGIPNFDDLSALVSTAGSLADVADAMSWERSTGEAEGFRQAAPSVAAGAEHTEDEAKAILGAAGIPMVPDRLATSREQARAAADELGYPVVLKIVSPDILHKSEAGGVALGLADGDAVGRAYDDVMKAVVRNAPSADIRGVLVSPMIGGGVETILGVKNDPTVGMTVAFGLGGIYVELLRDVSLRLAPFDTRTAAEMIREVRGFEILDGARGQEPLDLEALAQALSDLSHFAAANAATVESVDVNPFVVLPRGRGAYALDALITTRADQLDPHSTAAQGASLAGSTTQA
jgi:acyl-CoA synthetase (NDP forming)